MKFVFFAFGGEVCPGYCVFLIFLLWIIMSATRLDQNVCAVGVMQCTHGALKRREAQFKLELRVYAMHARGGVMRS